jgi:hypothetical protein
MCHTGTIHFDDGSSCRQTSQVEVSAVADGGDRLGQDERSLDARTWTRARLEPVAPATREKIVLPNGKTAWMDK